MRKLIEGKRIYLRQVTSGDAEGRYLQWLNDPAINRFLESRYQKWSKKSLKDYIKAINKNSANVFLAIVASDKDVHIGNIKVGPVDPRYKHADVGIVIGERAYWGKGFATEAIKLVIGYSFKTLKLHKLTAGAYANNIGSIKAFRRAGFSIEGVRRDQFCCNRAYCDGVLLGIVNK